MSLLGLLTKKVTKILYNYHYNNPPQRVSVPSCLIPQELVEVIN